MLWPGRNIRHRPGCSLPPPLCPERKTQPKIMRAEVWKETGKRKSRWKIRDLLAEWRCSRAVLDFLSATDVGASVGGGRCRERGDRTGAPRAAGVGRGEEGGGGKAGCHGGIVCRGEATVVPTDALFHGIRKRELGVGGGGGERRFPLFLPFVSHARLSPSPL